MKILSIGSVITSDSDKIIKLYNQTNTLIQTFCNENSENPKTCKDWKLEISQLQRQWNLKEFNGTDENKKLFRSLLEKYQKNEQDMYMPHVIFSVYMSRIGYHLDDLNTQTRSFDDFLLIVNTFSKYAILPRDILELFDLLLGVYPLEKYQEAMENLIQVHLPNPKDKTELLQLIKYC